MAKGDHFYYENFAACAALAKQAASYLVECLEDYDHERLEDMLKNRWDGEAEKFARLVLNRASENGGDDLSVMITEISDAPAPGTEAA